MYTVGEVSRIVGISAHTLRYYIKFGLLPFVKTTDGGIHVFEQRDFEWIYLIDCLKKSGMSLKDIKIFVELALKGDETIVDRLELFHKQREETLKEIKELEETLHLLDYKCWYYEEAKRLGSTEKVEELPLKKVPSSLRDVKDKFKKVYNLESIE